MKTRCKNIYIDIDNIEKIYKLFKKDIDSNYEKYIIKIKSEKQLHDDYLVLCNEIYNSIHKKQVGGGLITGGIVASSFIITSFVAYVIYNTINKETCKQNYSLYPTNKIANIGDVLGTIIPMQWINDGIESGKDMNQVLSDIGEYLDTLIDTFSIFDETKGSFFEKALKTTTKISLSIGAAIVTAGAGGDKAVNIPFFINKAVIMITKTFNKLQKTTSKITRSLKKMSNVYKKIQNNVDKIITSVEKINDSQNKILHSIKSNKKQLGFIHDLFNIDFRDGPYHCQCWVEYIMNNYVGKNKNLDEIKTLLCLINDIYLDVNESVVGFIGSTIDMFIPNSLGLAGTLAPLLQSYSHYIYRNVREELIVNYKSIPYDFRMLIQNPEKLSKYIFDMSNSYTFGLSNNLIPDSVTEYMQSGIDILAFSIHKSMSLIFMFLNVFIIFSELNNGINTFSKDEHTLDIEHLLSECKYCSNFVLNGIDKNGKIDKTDIDNCKRCQQFFNDDKHENDKEIYSKCIVYKQDNDEAKK